MAADTFTKKLPSMLYLTDPERQCRWIIERDRVGAWVGEGAVEGTAVAYFQGEFPGSSIDYTRDLTATVRVLPADDDNGFDIQLLSVHTK